MVAGNCEIPVQVGVFLTSAEDVADVRDMGSTFIPSLLKWLRLKPL